MKKSGRKTGVLSEERVGSEAAERTAGQREDLCGLHDSHDDDDEEDYEGEDGPGTFYSPVIAIDDKSLLDVLKHPKKH
jgi:hypothetical protein